MNNLLSSPIERIQIQFWSLKLASIESPTHSNYKNGTHSRPVYFHIPSHPQTQPKCFFIAPASPLPHKAFSTTIRTSKLLFSLPSLSLAAGYHSSSRQNLLVSHALTNIELIDRQLLAIEQLSFQVSKQSSDPIQHERPISHERRRRRAHLSYIT